MEILKLYDIDSIPLKGVTLDIEFQGWLRYYTQNCWLSLKFPIFHIYLLRVESGRWLIYNSKMFRKDLDKNMNVGLNQILVCLEDARLQGSTISGEKNFTLKKMRVFLRMSSFLTLGRVSESLYLMLRCFKVFRKENIWLRINIF